MKKYKVTIRYLNGIEDDYFEFKEHPQAKVVSEYELLIKGDGQSHSIRGDQVLRLSITEHEE